MVSRAARWQGLPVPLLPRISRNTKHPNSVRLTTLWDEEFEATPWVEKGNNWFGSPSADFHARPGDPNAKERAERFIRHAFKAVAVDIALHAAKTEAEQKTVREKVEHIVNDDEKAIDAASWLRKVLPRAGNATVVAVQQILVNVASEAVKKVLLGG